MKIVTANINGHDVAALSLYQILEAVGKAPALNALDTYHSVEEAVEFFYDQGRPDLVNQVTTLLAPVVEAEPEPKLTVKGGRIFANSKDVAEVFVRLHKNVIQSINNLDCSADFRRLNFQPNEINDLTGTSIESVDMTRDGLSFLIMGFTGAKAAHFKEAYIAAFNRMEAELRAQAALPDFNNPAIAARAWADQVEARQEAEKKLTIAAPKVQVYEEIAASEGTMLSGDAAKHLGMGPIKFHGWLHSIEWIFRREGVWVPYQPIRDKGWMTVIASTRAGRGGIRVRIQQPRVTPGGLLMLTHIMKRHEVIQ
ncbi:phage regulatory protein/antirepressor Ant [Telmatospirillum sp.]|uniref:Rha family transcriptional regulator n=1 Tax=Telmatospirillum sp. TaxID=2079197 RepID=UPI0028459402|nr:phage regulatory protein/antirepressor Ant [Telmatospirillum sp.]MDR3436475.1 phage regulatory protein/antirepressor Ant [Telmatospirillum sp.]